MSGITYLTYFFFSVFLTPTYMDICILPSDTGIWTRSSDKVTPQIRAAYSNYKERDHYYRECPYITGDYIVYRPENDPYLGTYIARIDDIDPSALGDGPESGIGPGEHLRVRQEIHDRLTTKMPIIDMYDIYAFIIDNQLNPQTRANWVACRDYQAWAFRDFIYDKHNSVKKSYMSPYSSYLAFTNNILANQIVTIDIPDLSPNIIFNVSRNENNSVFFERNDAQRSRVRMCDNEYARAGYLGYYTRLTMDIGLVIIPPVYSSSQSMTTTNGSGSDMSEVPFLTTGHLSPVESTDNENEQCILCNMYRINVKFSPCEHATCCSECYSKMVKNICPVCRTPVTRLMQP